ncbi:hypothetical protein D3C78_1065240 [compost metagenome]
MLRRDAIDVLGEGAHELDFTAGDDVGLEVLAAQVIEHFQHRLINHLGVGLTGFRVAGLAEPGFRVVHEGRGGDPGVGRADDLHQAFHATLGQSLVVVLQHGLEGLLGFPFRVLGRHALDFLQGEQHLEVHRLLTPQRAVVVEHGDALSGLDVVPGAFGGHRLDKLDDAFLRGAIVPRGQGLGRLDQQRQAQRQGQQQFHPV